jgi:protoporphyrinogen oxidase
VRGYLVKRVKNFYPRYDLLYEDRLKTIYNKIKSVNNLILTGRIGMYNYNNADHCLDMGCFIAEKMTNNIHPNQILDDLIEHVRSYKIVD